MAGGESFSEGAHIKPLGRPHHGQDSGSNILSLCPNHHAQLDGGGIYVNDDKSVIDRATGKAINTLWVKNGHNIDWSNFEHQRDHFNQHSE